MQRPERLERLERLGPDAVERPVEGVAELPERRAVERPAKHPR